jgi:uncharacterized protein YukE
MFIRVDTDQMQEVASHLARAGQELAQARSRCAQAWNALESSGWEGQHRARLTGEWLRVSECLAQVDDAAMALSSWLSRCAELFLATDQRTAALFGPGGPLALLFGAHAGGAALAAGSGLSLAALASPLETLAEAFVDRQIAQGVFSGVARGLGVSPEDLASLAQAFDWDEGDIGELADMIQKAGLADNSLTALADLSKAMPFLGPAIGFGLDYGLGKDHSARALTTDSVVATGTALAARFVPGVGEVMLADAAVEVGGKAVVAGLQDVRTFLATDPATQARLEASANFLGQAVDDMNLDVPVHDAASALYDTFTGNWSQAGADLRAAGGDLIHAGIGVAELPLAVDDVVVNYGSAAVKRIGGLIADGVKEGLDDITGGLL